MMEGPPGADSEEKHEPASDVDTVAVDSLKALDPEWPIREADVGADILEPPLRAKGDIGTAAYSACGRALAIRGTGIYGIFRRARADHSALMLAVRITFAHFS